MKILFCGSEAVPFVKTGGLADVATSLTRQLAVDGHDVTLILPYTPQLLPSSEKQNFTISEPTESFSISIRGQDVQGCYRTACFPGSDLKVILVDHFLYFDRPGLYVEEGKDYADNCERFAFFSRAVIEYARKMETPPDVIHANDWQTGLVPILIKEQLRHEAGYENVASVFTIHNMNYQGRFDAHHMEDTGLDGRYFHMDAMEFYGGINLLKTGISFADKITTVSPTYSKEIQTEAFGCGLEGVLTSRKKDLVGILNGVDLNEWNPASDPFIIQNYTADTVLEGKPLCKEALQKEFGLPVRPEVPLVGMVSRMAEQKGFDIIREAAGLLLDCDAQYIFLGTGQEEYENSISALAKFNPNKVAAKIGFSETTAHQIEAGSDIFLMPSRFEPCGLNQMYSMIYGTIPVVRAVGGLVDSVVNYNNYNLIATKENRIEKSATGFSFIPYQANALAQTMHNAFNQFAKKPLWEQLVQNGMRADWSWKRSADQYVSLYQQAQSNLTRST